MSDRSYSEKRRTLLKTVGVALGAVGSAGPVATADGAERRRSGFEAWTGVRSGPNRTGATDDRGPTPFPATDWRTDLEGSMYDVEPVVAGETVYLAVTSDNGPGEQEGYVGAYDGRTGDRRWKRSDLPATKTPSLGDGTLYVVTRDYETSGVEEAGVYALDARSGDTEWTRLQQPHCTTPVVADDRVYLANERGAFALDPDTGDTVWHAEGVGGIAERAEGASSYADGTVFFSDGTALDADTGSVEWEVDDDAILGNNVAGDERVYFVRTDYVDGDDDEIRVEARSMADGKVEWTHEDMNERDGRLALADGRLFLLDSSDDSSVVKALDADTGTATWTRTTSGELRSDPTVADGTVYVGGWYAPTSADRESRALVYALDTSTGRRKWAYLLDSDGLATSPENPPAAGTPAVVDGRLYVATYPGESTLDYRYVRYSNFHALRSADRRPGEECRPPADPPGDDRCPAVKACIDAMPDLDSCGLEPGDAIELDASCSTGRELGYEWDTDGDGRYDEFGSCVRVTVPDCGSVTVRLGVTDARGRTDATAVTIPSE
ncbi:outer membrane protein assembly factor BamB family protein [Halomicrococcus sp. SG-WS-1]|uniref:outer membrane protein assembly factor BamB family protein n=1 Tax=Halomicrococcus sp. SG-WS-1 TaxID=3439057 RepID=UPI003F7A6C2B